MLITACSPATVSTPTPKGAPTLTPTETIAPTLTEGIIIEPTPALDVSGWIVKVGEMKCNLEPLGEEYQNWYVAVCPEELWLPIGQTTQVEVIASEEGCDLKPAEDLEKITKEYFTDALQLEFVQMEDNQWGCQVPYSDTAGIELVCVFECGEKDIGLIIQGKTIRVYTGGNGGSSGSEGGQTVPPPRQPDEPSG